MPPRSSLRTSENCFASAVMRAAYESPPTRMTRASPLPATTVEPDMSSRPGPEATGSASPVSSDSSTSSPCASSTSASAVTWSPAASTRMSSSTTSAVGASTVVPSRSTRAFGALSTASLLRVILARNSCATPMTTLAMTKSPNRASCQ